MRQKLNHARAILEALMDVIASISRCSATLEGQTSYDSSVQLAFQTDLNNISNDLRNHERIVKKLLAFSEDIRLMVCIPAQFNRLGLIADNRIIKS